jgi:uncharacterized protein (DUF1330 family)
VYYKFNLFKLLRQTGAFEMTVYLIAEIKVTDDNWVPDYAAKVHPIVEKHGGKYLSRSGNIKVLEGEDRGNTFIAILQFPDAASVEAFATDPEYTPHGKARQEGAINSFQLIDDTDAAGTIPYLSAG